MLKKVLLGPIASGTGAEDSLSDVKSILDRHGVSCEICLSRQSLPADMSGFDMVIAMGGDGTILHAARAAAPWGVPVLGINFGTKGFIADLERGELEAVNLALEGRGRVEDRMMLDASIVRRGEIIHKDFALNELVIGGVARAINVEALGDGQSIMSFSGDGIVAATPTGSTAYSMSAGGPIVEPDAECIVITPICAHMLTAKSFILSSKRTVTVRLGDLEGKRAYFSADGCEPVALSGKDEIVIRKSALSTRMIRVNEESFYRKVSRKLGEL
jgi:NAD+ kinase